MFPAVRTCCLLDKQFVHISSDELLSSYAFSVTSVHMAGISVDNPSTRVTVSAASYCLGAADNFSRAQLNNLSLIHI